MKLFEELSLRGLVKQTTSEKVEEILNGASINFYCGFDPTADSLHIGSLLPLIMMLRLQKAGHKATVLFGNATSSIGDPSFKSAERQMLSKDVIDQNLLGVKSQVEKILPEANFVENLDWFKNMSSIDFLREVGKYFTVNSMLTKDAIKSRLEDRDQGISFTEFSYMLLQAQDFKHLFLTNNVTLQLGGADQWGNCVAGVSLIRKTLNKEAFALTFPLITKSDGSKFGKTESGNIWLDPKKTSPFEFFQFFLNVSDADTDQLINFLSLKQWLEIEEIKNKSKQNPSLRFAQQSLAEELTILVHGEAGLMQAKMETEAKFGQATTNHFDLMVSKEVIGSKLIDILVQLGLSSSKSMAKKDIRGQGIKINGQKVLDVEKVLEVTDFIKDKLTLSKGKANHKIIKLSEEY